MRQKLAAFIIIASLFGGVGHAQTTATTSVTLSCTQAAGATQMLCNLSQPISFTLNGGVTLQQGTSLVLGPSTGLSCSISPQSTTATIGATAMPTLTAQCSGGTTPYTYQWTKGGNNEVGETSQTYTVKSADVQTAGQTLAYSVVVKDATNAQTTPTATVAVAAAGLQRPNSCTVTVTSSSNISVGGTATLQANCTTGGLATSYRWFKNGIEQVTKQSQIYTVDSSETQTAGTLSFTVKGVNSAGSSDESAAQSIQIAAQASGGINYCPNNQQPSSSLDASLPYARIYSTNLVGSSTYFVVKLTVPSSGASTVGRYTAQIQHAQSSGSTPTLRTITLSKNLCDFTSTAIFAATASSSSAFDFTIQDQRAGFSNLTPGTWYINVRNDACGAGTACNMFMDWYN